MSADTIKPKKSEAPALDVALDVPEVSSLPEPSDVVAYADFLLTCLLRHNNGILHGEFKSGIGRWYIRLPLNGEEVEIARLDSVGHFRAVLARFGYWYLAVQLYGGLSDRKLIQRGRQYDCKIAMSNDNRSGYSLRIEVG